MKSYNTPFEEIEELIQQYQKHQVTINISKTVFLANNKNCPEIDFQLFGKQFKVFVNDEYNDLLTNSPLLSFYLVLRELEDYENASDYLEWCKHQSYDASNEEIREYHINLYSIHNEVKEMLGTIDSVISNYDFELNTGAAKEIRTMNQLIFISPLIKSDFSVIIALSNQLFGQEYITEKELKRYINNENCIGIVVRFNNNIAGFELLDICSANELKEIALNNFDWFSEKYTNHLPVGVIKTIGVNEKFKKKGLGLALTNKGIEILKDKTISIISICWEQKNDSPFMRLLEKVGLKPIHKINDFWNTDSLNKEYNCSICGSPPCKCNAVIYQLPID